jgi:anti-sigma B factor antagonist
MCAMSTDPGVGSGSGRAVGHLAVREEGTRVVLLMVGEIDMATIHAAAAELDRLLDAPPDQLDVDLSQVTFMDSSGVGALVKLHMRMDGQVRRMRLVGPTPAVVRLLRISGLDGILSVEQIREPGGTA